MANVSAELNMFIQVMLLVVALILLASLVRGFGYPHRQAAFANTELLRLNLNKACAGGPGTVVEMEGFELPQNIPPDFGGVPYVGGIFPYMFLKTNGDPTYLLYYENFPASESIGWEVYTDPDIRFVGTAGNDAFNIENQNDLKASEILEEYQRSMIEKWASSSITFRPPSDHPIAETGGILNNIVFANLVLQDNLPDIPIGQKVEEKKIDIITSGDVGVWKNKGAYSFYEFTAYSLLSTTNKSLIKYRSCGPGNICLKTNDGVYAFPLDACKNSNGESKIKYVQLVYDVGFSWNVQLTKVGLTGGGAVGTITLAQLTKFVFTKVGSKLLALIPAIGTAIAGGATAWEFKEAIVYPFTQWYLDKHSDFYLASPCEYTGKVRIEYAENCLDNNLQGKYKCENMIKYPIYDVDKKDETVKKIGEHYSCLDNSQSVGNSYGEKVSGNVACLRVIFEPDIKNNFCWTSNLKPIREGSYYVPEHKGFVLGDKENYDKIISEDEELLETLKEMTLITQWRWPR